MKGWVIAVICVAIACAVAATLLVLFLVILADNSASTATATSTSAGTLSELRLLSLNSLDLSGQEDGAYVGINNTGSLVVTTNNSSNIVTALTVSAQDVKQAETNTFTSYFTSRPTMHPYAIFSNPTGDYVVIGVTDTTSPPVAQQHYLVAKKSGNVQFASFQTLPSESDLSASLEYFVTAVPTFDPDGIHLYLPLRKYVDVFTAGVGKLLQYTLNDAGVWVFDKQVALPPTFSVGAEPKSFGIFSSVVGDTLILSSQEDAVYVYNRTNGGDWSWKQTITGTNSNKSAQYGSTSSLSPNERLLCISDWFGKPSSDAASNAGYVEVYTRAGVTDDFALAYTLDQRDRNVVRDFFGWGVQWISNEILYVGIFNVGETGQRNDSVLFAIYEATTSTATLAFNHELSLKGKPTGTGLDKGGLSVTVQVARDLASPGVADSVVAYRFGVARQGFVDADTSATKSSRVDVYDLYKVIE